MVDSASEVLININPSQLLAYTSYSTPCNFSVLIVPQHLPEINPAYQA